MNSCSWRTSDLAPLEHLGRERAGIGQRQPRLRSSGRKGGEPGEILLALARLAPPEFVVRGRAQRLQPGDDARLEGERIGAPDFQRQAEALVAVCDRVAMLGRRPFAEPEQAARGPRAAVVGQRAQMPTHRVAAARAEPAKPVEDRIIVGLLEQVEPNGPALRVDVIKPVALALVVPLLIELDQQLPGGVLDQRPLQEQPAVGRGLKAARAAGGARAGVDARIDELPLAAAPQPANCVCFDRGREIVGAQHMQDRA